MAQFINLFTWGYRCLAVQAPSIEKTTYFPSPFSFTTFLLCWKFPDNVYTCLFLGFLLCCIDLFIFPLASVTVFIVSSLYNKFWSKVLLVTLLLLFLSIFCCSLSFSFSHKLESLCQYPQKDLLHFWLILNYTLNYKKKPTLTIFNISTHKHELSLQLSVLVFISSRSYSFH